MNGFKYGTPTKGKFAYGPSLQNIPKAMNGKVVVPATQKHQSDAAEVHLQFDEAMQMAFTPLEPAVSPKPKSTVSDLSFDFDAAHFDVDPGVVGGDLTHFIALGKGVGKSSMHLAALAQSFKNVGKAIPTLEFGGLLKPKAALPMELVPLFYDDTKPMVTLLRKTLVEGLPDHLMLGVVLGKSNYTTMLSDWARPAVAEAYLAGATHHLSVWPSQVIKHPHNQTFEVWLTVVAMTMDHYFSASVPYGAYPSKDTRALWRMASEVAEAFEPLNCASMHQKALPVIMQAAIQQATQKDPVKLAQLFEVVITLDQHIIEDWVLTNA